MSLGSFDYVLCKILDHFRLILFIRLTKVTRLIILREVNTLYSSNPLRLTIHGSEETG